MDVIYAEGASVEVLLEVKMWLVKYYILHIPKRAVLIRHKIFSSWKVVAFCVGTEVKYVRNYLLTYLQSTYPAHWRQRKQGK